MKTAQNFGLLYILLAIIQLAICNYVRISPYIFISILPVMVLCIPVSKNTTAAMLIAFVTGLATDALGEGLLGLNALALVPVAFMRKTIIQAVFGKDMIEREEQFTIKHNGPLKVSIAMLIAIGTFLAIYIMADGAGTRPFWFNFSRFWASLACGYIISLPVVNALNGNGRK